MLGASALILDFGVVDDSDMLHALELCAGDACLSASYDAFDMRAKPMDAPGLHPTPRF